LMTALLVSSSFFWMNEMSSGLGTKSLERSA
jgi:hypothetical protein